jgi:hypothetical protein
MSEQTQNIVEERKDTLNSFLKRWNIEEISNMTLNDYNANGNKDSFCYWLEHVADNLGRIKGVYSSIFGIWQMKTVKKSLSKDFKDDGNYKWYSKYGNTADDAFNKIQELVLEIATNALNGDFKNIDKIDYFSLAKWKIAFIYSNSQLFPVYNKTALRQIAKNFDYTNYRSEKLSSIHEFLVTQKPEKEDLFDFAFRQYHVTIQNSKNNYYVIGSKYRDDSGEYYSIASSLYERSVISTGFFWNEDLANLYGKPRGFISKWFDKNLLEKYPDNYKTAKRVLSFFLNIKEGDIIAVKSHGQYGNLTIIAYAEVIKINGKIYYHDDSSELGHCINVIFLETDLNRDVGLSYGQTIHQIIPNKLVGHFEKIFGSYAVLEKEEIQELETADDFELSESRINDKQTKSRKRNVSYSTTVRHIHNKIQSAFAKQLLSDYPNDIVRTEHNFIDIVRQHKTELFYYEVKPYNTAYNCIRTAIGQLLDYYHSNPHSKKEIHLRVIGSAPITTSDKEFIDFIKDSLSISFDYISFNKY